MDVAPATDLFRFGARKAATGYAWLDAVDQHRRTRSRFLSAGVTDQWIRFQPFDEFPALFQVFANLEVTEAVVAAFANRFGLLGVERTIRLRDGRVALGETLVQWADEIAYMRHAIRILQTLEEHDEEALEEMVDIRNDSGARGSKPRDVGVTVSYRAPRDLPPLMADVPEVGGRAGVIVTVRFPKPSVVALLPSFGTAGELDEQTLEPPTTAANGAWLLLSQIVNERLLQFTNGAVRPHRPTARQRLPVAFRIEPSNLLGALWVQFALAMSGETYRQCEECGRWFPVKPKGRRADTRFHTDECRAKAHHRKKTVARQLAASGIGVRDIATKLKTDERRVRSWIKRETAKRKTPKGRTRSALS
jgi:hypothetical protein